MSLRDLGWTEHLDLEFQPYAEQGLEAGRVVLEQRHRYTLKTDREEVDAEIAGRLLKSGGPATLPVVGDWVCLRRAAGHLATIQAVLPRKSKLSRNIAGRQTREQVVAANLDKVFLVMGLDGDFNLRRLERLLVTAWESGAEPVVVLNKADLASRPEQRRREAQATAPGVAVAVSSCHSSYGTEEIRSYLEARETVVMMGSSGVGKSTLINRLVGQDLLPTAAVRESDDRGCHTTTHRQLVALPEGALLIDSPGIRELQLWSSEEGLEIAFDDLKTLAKGCRFRDCTHRDEPGCAVRASVEAGRLAAGRLRNYHDLEKELRALAVRQDKAASRQAGKRAQAMYRGAKKAKSRRKVW